jgi:NAD-dependent SIR2 family protein deacetylase
MALQRGAKVVEVNATITPLTISATFMLRGVAGEILPELIKAVWGQQ